MDTHEYTQALRVMLEPHADASISVPMKKYMKNHFDFIGIKSPERKQLLRDFIHQNGLPDSELITPIVKTLWGFPFREYQYCAMTLVERRLRTVEKQFHQTIEFMILNKSWWDTVDFVAATIAGKFFRKFPEYIPAKTDEWCSSDNMWLNRTAILFQLKYKKETNTDLLSNYILPHTTSKEFFIQKAIGWSLREFSKTDPTWVQNFVSNNQLAPLSVREGLKWLNRKSSLR